MCAAAHNTPCKGLLNRVDKRLWLGPTSGSVLTAAAEPIGVSVLSEGPVWTYCCATSSCCSNQFNDSGAPVVASVVSNVTAVSTDVAIFFLVAASIAVVVSVATSAPLLFLVLFLLLVLIRLRSLLLLPLLLLLIIYPFR